MYKNTLDNLPTGTTYKVTDKVIRFFVEMGQKTFDDDVSVIAEKIVLMHMFKLSKHGSRARLQGKFQKHKIIISQSSSDRLHRVCLLLVSCLSSIQLNRRSFRTPCSPSSGVVCSSTIRLPY